MEGFVRGMESLMELFRLMMMAVAFLLPFSVGGLIAAGLWYLQLPNAASAVMLLGIALGFGGLLSVRRLLPL